MADPVQPAPRKFSCGLDFSCVPDLRKRIQYASDIGFDFLCFPIIHPRFKREFLSGKAKNRPGAFTRSDLILVSSDWNNLIVGKLSPYLNVDSKNEVIRRNSTAAMNQELSYAVHLGLPAIMINMRGGSQINLARIINAQLQSHSPCQVWMRVPMVTTSVFVSNYLDTEEGSGDMSPSAQREDTWEWWNTFRSLCNFDKKLAVALELTTDTPSPEEIQRWVGEPVRCLIISTSMFVTNKRGYPVLLKAHQNLLRQFSQLELQMVLHGTMWHGSYVYYYQYLEHLWQRFAALDPHFASYARGFEDFLQCPLQPLMDNLESHTYEVFEQDPTKYNEYQRAIYNALLDRVPDANQGPIVVMVLGAGRGPLVRASLHAADKANRDIKVYAVEKNPNAVVSLQALQQELWKDKVTVVSCDMREFDPPEKADIMVSELLGSFGDNELSPECLDGAQKFLKEDGISIPMKYTSYLSPVQSSKLYNEVRLWKDRDKSPVLPFETLYVVHLQNKFQLAPPKDVFTFVHPNKDEVFDNSRYKILDFQVSQKSVLHGFAGYFDTLLYSGSRESVTLSIKPETCTKGMFSWFPIFFPIKEPIQLNSGDIISLHFWRVCDKKSVWYEWCTTSPIPTPIHNPKGRSYTIGL